MAMEVLLAQAKRDGTPFPEGLPLVPTLDDLTGFLSAARKPAPLQGAAARRIRRKPQDDGSDGDRTYFLGTGKRMRQRDPATLAAMNAVGFFLYTMCDDNKGDKWPQTMSVFC